MYFKVRMRRFLYYFYSKSQIFLVVSVIVAIKYGLISFNFGLWLGFVLKCVDFGLCFWLTSNKIFGFVIGLTRLVQNSNVDKSKGSPQICECRNQSSEIGFILFLLKITCEYFFFLLFLRELKVQHKSYLANRSMLHEKKQKNFKSLKFVQGNGLETHLVIYFRQKCVFP